MESLKHKGSDKARHRADQWSQQGKLPRQVHKPNQANQAKSNIQTNWEAKSQKPELACELALPDITIYSSVAGVKAWTAQTPQIEDIVLTFAS